MTEIPDEVGNDEPLHRRIHPTFVQPDGRISSQAFKDPEMSVDRAQYTSIEQTVLGYETYGVAEFLTEEARELGQEVVADKELLNQAHALVRGNKSKRTARRLARLSHWAKPIELS
ncbi:MAG: hypothetical protein AAGN66_09570 [Acidobacteriota bacterium]